MTWLNGVAQGGLSTLMEVSLRTELPLPELFSSGILECATNTLLSAIHHLLDPLCWRPTLSIPLEWVLDEEDVVHLLPGLLPPSSSHNVLQTCTTPTPGADISTPSDVQNIPLLPV